MINLGATITDNPALAYRAEHEANVLIALREGVAALRLRAMFAQQAVRDDNGTVANLGVDLESQLRLLDLDIGELKREAARYGA